MFVKWKDDLSVGIDWIDRQHQELFKRINSFLEGMQKGKGKEELEELMDFLANYVQEHFQTEERYMQKYNYPGLSEHKKQHQSFIQEVENLKGKFAEEGPSLTLTLQAQNKISNWILNHIKKVDMEMGAFLKGKEK